MRYLTAGESHGRALTAVIEGFPANVPIDFDLIKLRQKRRQGGYGRGGRMVIESDRLEILSGVRNGKTTGSPITLQIDNKDWENWKDIMDPITGVGAQLNLPRPGHADLPGIQKYLLEDGRNILERSSARETAVRTAVGSFALILLKELRIRAYHHVSAIGNVKARETSLQLLESEDHYNSPLYCLCPEGTKEMLKAIDDAKAEGDTLGGIFEVIVLGLPTGLGSHVQWDRKLDGKIAQGLFSLQGIKAVEFGAGLEGCLMPGSRFHDEIFYSNKGYYRNTNNAGGIEGGMTNGSPLVVRCGMKPIPTLMKPLQSVNIKTKEPERASVERSDVCAVPAASVVAQGVVAFSIAEVLTEKFGRDTLQEINRAIEWYKERCKS
jgi:chorismate synthase